MTRKKPSTAKPAKDPVKVKRGRNAIRKGKQFERDLANLLGHIFPEAKRHIESQASEAIEGRDIDNTDVYKIQCKNKQNYVNPSTIYEVKLTSPDDVPVLVTKGNKLPPMVVIPLENFIHLLEVEYGLQAPKVSQSVRGQSHVATMARALPPFVHTPLFPAEPIDYQDTIEATAIHLEESIFDLI